MVILALVKAPSMLLLKLLMNSLINYMVLRCLQSFTLNLDISKLVNNTDIHKAAFKTHKGH